MLWIRIYYYADRIRILEEEKLHQQISTKSFKMTLKNHLKLPNKQNKILSITKGPLLLIFQFCIRLMNLYIF